MWVIKTRRIPYHKIYWGKWRTVWTYDSKQEAEKWLAEQKYPSHIEYRIDEVNKD